MLAALMTGCSAAGFGLVNLPAHFARTKRVLDIAYGTRADQKLDVYYPAAAAHPNLPVVVFLYGGRWTHGKRAHYRFVAKTLTALGYAVVIPDYAKYPAVRFPVFVEDAAAAIAWTHSHAAAYGFDADQISVVGHSAGAHIGALVATDAHYLAAHGGTRDWIHRFVGLAGPYAFVPDKPDLIDMFGPPEHYAQMRVSTFIDGKQPPMFLLQGGRGTLVGEQNIAHVKTMVDERGGVLRTQLYPTLGHISILGALSWVGDDQTSALDDIDGFLRAPDAG
jgi:acetyl esterase/lipase